MVIENMNNKCLVCEAELPLKSGRGRPRKYCPGRCAEQARKAANKAAERARRTSLKNAIPEFWASARLAKIRRDSKRRAPLGISPEDLCLIFLQTRGYCPVTGCGRVMNLIGERMANTATVDRIDNNRGYESGNVQVICHQCNSDKGALSIEAMKYHLDAHRRGLAQEPLVPRGAVTYSPL